VLRKQKLWVRELASTTVILPWIPARFATSPSVARAATWKLSTSTSCMQSHNAVHLSLHSRDGALTEPPSTSSLLHSPKLDRKFSKSSPICSPLSGLRECSSWRESFPAMAHASCSPLLIKRGGGGKKGETGGKGIGLNDSFAVVGKGGSPCPAPPLVALSIPGIAHSFWPTPSGKGGGGTRTSRTRSVTVQFFNVGGIECGHV